VPQRRRGLDDQAVVAFHAVPSRLVAPGRTEITEATRRAYRNMTRPFTILGLT